METMNVRKISTSVLAMHFQVLWIYKVSLASIGRGKSYQWPKFSIFLFLTTLSVINTVSENLQKTQGFCVADFATLSDERMLLSKISTI